MNYCISALLLCLLLFSCTLETTPEIQRFSTIHKTAVVSSSELQNLIPSHAKLWNDTLYLISSDSSGNSTIALYSYPDLTPLTSFNSWIISESTSDTFGTVNTLHCTEKFLFAGNMRSQVDVFDRATLDYITTVGTGNWWGNEEYLIVHSFALASDNEKLYIRDKHNIRVYLLADLLPQNRKAVPRYAQSVALGGNSSKKQHGMIIHGSSLYVSDYARKKVYRFNTDEFTKGALEVTPKDSLLFSDRPYDVTFLEDELLTLSSEDMIQKWNLTTKEVVKKQDAIEGYQFSAPSTFSIEGDRFLIIDQSSLICAEILHSELEIYPRGKYE